jgi:hypothetical protein
MGEILGGLRRSRLVYVIVAATLALLFVPMGLAAGQEEPVDPDGGLLILELGPSANQFVYDPVVGATLTQQILEDGCEAELSTSGDVLVTIDTSDSTPKGVLGLFDDGLGEKGKGKNGNGQPCGRFDGPDESMTLALAGDIADKEIVLAELDIEAKFDVIVNGELYLDGSKVADAEPLMTGTLSDSGPDSADGDNYRWIIDEGVLFDEIILSVDPATPSGAFSLHGGADGTMPGSLGLEESVFQLTDVDGVIACGESTITAGTGDTSPEATFQRGQNNVTKGDPNCLTLIEYTLEVETTANDQTVIFEFEEDEFPSWYGEFTWAPEAATMPVPATVIDEDGDGTFESTLEWCDGFETDGIGDVVLDPFLGVPIPILPAGASWCVYDQSTALLVDGTIQVTQDIYGLTDPQFKRSI